MACIRMRRLSGYGIWWKRIAFYLLSQRERAGQIPAYLMRFVRIMRSSKKKPAPKARLTREEALACTPVKSGQVSEERLSTGDAILSYPVAMRPWMVTIARWTGRVPDAPQMKNLQLDKLGTTVWDLMDGDRTVNQVIKQFAREFKVQHSEAEVSVTRFLRELGRRGLIGLD